MQKFPWTGLLTSFLFALFLYGDDVGAIRAVAPLQPLLFSPPFSPQKGRVKKKKKICLNKKEYLSYLFLKPFVVFLFFQASRPERAGEVYPVKHGAQ